MTKNEQLLEFFYSIITESKRAKFDKIAAERTRHLTVIIENVYQEQNASAIVRSCDCFGIHDIHAIEKDNSFSVNREIAMGAGKWVNIQHHQDPKFPTTTALNKLKQKGYRIVATTPHEEDTNIDELDLTQPTALLFGTEKMGLSEAALSQADAYVRIPMYGFSESFNVSVSAALCLHSLRQKLEKMPAEHWKMTHEEQVEVKLDWCRNILRNVEASERDFLKSIQ
ncbi:MAG: RNA methyltransferase [Crocinitomicaceae bacterium]|nr:RNA methyltransferase [Crocinitomicaceae bacterium]